MPIRESIKESKSYRIDDNLKENILRPRKGWNVLKGYINTITRLKRNDAKTLEVASDIIREIDEF